MNNDLNKQATIAAIERINAVEGFDPSVLAVDYSDLSSNETRRRLPVMSQMAWFRLKYPEGRIAVTVTAAKDCFVASARIYAHYNLPPDQYLAEATASRGYLPDKPTVSPREWAQTAASVSLFATQALACSSVRPVTPLIHRPWMSWAPSRGVPPQQGKLPPLARPHLYLRQQPRLRRRPLRNCRRWRRPCVPPALSRDIRIRRWAIWSRLTPTHWFGSLPNSPVMQRSLQLRNSSAIRRWQAHKQTLWRGGTKVSSLHREEPLWTIT